ncbi:OmpP1/FadL family transporter [Rhizobium sp. Leaf341]|uniref:OmpP1/FadL family transporter n=1 Tax=Rhizobium sp. Leaf341 TaxID=1736344 RepID=UPI0007152DDA|nr:OmpP1/FadL family transporter [Rhizobium sp. Leaf341]KQR67914.1 long-chain fatty acid transporter [Rhizobium sp. Leaf341]
MSFNFTRSVIATAVLAAMTATSAQAGGLERGGYNIDLLFDPSAYALEATTTYVNPQRDLKNGQDTNAANGLGANGLGGGSTSVRDTESYWVPRVGVKAALGDSGIDCMADYSQPFGADINPGRNWIGANDNTKTKIKTDNYAVTCSYKWAMGPGKVRVIAGGFYQEVEGYKERLVAPNFYGTGNGIGRLDLEDNGWGGRVGLAYEIPEYAFLTSLVYNSEVKYDDIEGTIDLSQVTVPGPGGPASPITFGKYAVTGEASVPQSLEYKIQTGIAPDWLAFGSVKWTDWSVLQSVKFCPATLSPLTPCTSLDLLYRDGLTVTAGVGHKFNDQWSGAVSLTWDRGTSTVINTQSDTWTLGTGVAYKPVDNVEFRLAGAVGILTSGSSRSTTIDGVPFGNNVRYDYGNDVVTAVSTSLKVRF